MNAVEVQGNPEPEIEPEIEQNYLELAMVERAEESAGDMGVLGESSRRARPPPPQGQAVPDSFPKSVTWFANWLGEGRKLTAMGQFRSTGSN